MTPALPQGWLRPNTPHVMLAAHKADGACWVAQVAVASGDVRRALELCRKAAEVAEEQGLVPPPAGGAGPAGAGSPYNTTAAPRDAAAPSPPTQPCAPP